MKPATKAKKKKKDKASKAIPIKSNSDNLSIRRSLIPMDLTLKFFLESDEREVIEFILSNMGGVTDGENFIFIDNKSQVLFQAHMDTVRSKKKEVMFPNVVNVGNVILNLNGVLGADDRAGCYLMWRINKYCLDEGISPPSLLFTNYEESGSDGMKEFVKEEKLTQDIQSYVNLIIALDRRGCGHYVKYVDNPDEIDQYMRSFGFCKEWGSFSDSKILSEKTSIPQVNLAVGFHHEHTDSEVLHLDEMDMCFERMKKLIQSPINELYKVKQYVTPVAKWPYASTNHAANQDDWWKEDYEDYHYDERSNLYAPGKKSEQSSSDDPMLCAFCGDTDIVLNICVDDTGCAVDERYLLCDDCVILMREHIRVIGAHYNCPKAKGYEIRDIVEKSAGVKGLSPQTNRSGYQYQCIDSEGSSESDTKVKDFGF